MLGRTTTGGHFGLIVLLREGVAAWMAHASTRPTVIDERASAQVPAKARSPVAFVISDELRDDMALVLASMVMTTSHEGRCA